MSSSTSAVQAGETHVHHPKSHAVPVGRPHLRVSWGAILAGSVIALALLFMLSLLAIGVGAGVVDPAQDANPLSGVGIGSGIFVIAAQLIALLVGGFIAAKLAGIPLGLSSALHGAAVWALATFAMLFLATTAFSGLLGGATSMIASAGSGASSAVEAAVPENLGLGQIDTQSLPPAVQDAMEQRNMTPEDLQADAQAIFKDTISQQERQEAMAAMKDTASAIASSPGSAGAEIDKLIDQLFGADGGVLSEQDRNEAVASLSDRLGVSKQEAEQTIDQWQSQVTDSVEEVRAAAEGAVEQATQAAQATSEALSKAALGGFVASLLGLCVAMLGGFFGRQEDVVAAPAENR